MTEKSNTINKTEYTPPIDADGNSLLFNCSAQTITFKQLNCVQPQQNPPYASTLIHWPKQVTSKANLQSSWQIMADENNIA